MQHAASPYPPRQRGIATLAIALVLLFLVSILLWRTSANLLLELKTTNNQYQQTQALEAARGGIDYGYAWLKQKAGTPAWHKDSTLPAPYNQRASLPTQKIGQYEVKLALWQDSAAPGKMELQAEARGDALAVVRQKIAGESIFNHASNAPIVINGCMSGIKGRPSINGVNGGSAITSSADKSCLDTGHLSLGGGSIESNAFDDSGPDAAWNHVFAISKAEAKALAAKSSSDDIHFFDASNPAPHNWHQNVGTPSKPGMLIIDSGGGCPKLNGGVQIYGIVYLSAQCSSSNGWGGAHLTGSLISEGGIDKLGANTSFSPWPGGGNPDFGVETGLTRVKGSWRDF